MSDRPIVVRDPDLDLDRVPRHWLANSAAALRLFRVVQSERVSLWRRSRSGPASRT